ncbi:MAG: AraC family transcriptional regulator [Proteobacteria bacterium]|nr:AraC family transcriptional regulator [Pseudomonadota bacterium]
MIDKALIITTFRRLFFTCLLMGFVSMICILIFFYGKGPNINEIVSLEGNWRISLDDDERFLDPNFDDSSWDSVNLPGSMIHYSLSKKGRVEGVLWLRKQFYLPSDIEKTRLGLILGRIGNADMTYVNGVMVGGMGGFPPHEFSMWNHPRNYLIHASDLRYGENNMIAIRISYNNFCEILGRLAISDYKNFKHFKTATTFSTITAGYIAIAIGQVLLIIFCIFYLVRPSSEEYYYYCLPLFFGQPIIFEICTYWNVYHNTLWRIKILSITLTGLCVTHTIFLHRIYEFERKGIEAFLKVYFIIDILFSLLVINTNNIRTYAPVIIIFSIGIFLYSLTCNIEAIIRKKPYSRFFGLFGIGFLLFVTHDCFVYLSKLSSFDVYFSAYKPGMTSNLATVLLYLGTALVLVKRLIHIMDEVEDLNASLENYIIENTILSKKLTISTEKEDEPTVFSKTDDKKISSRAQEKIVKVMHFIDENYSTEISRLKLADSFGIHPDSLGKKFKTFTGKKLGDYIYELRIKEAARRLKEEDTNIIDIAFDVGFESIRTFQRIFPKYMGQTPDQYRKQHRKN